MSIWAKSWYRPVLTFGIVALTLFTIHSCITFRMSANELEDYLSTKTLNGKHKYIQRDSRTIHYAVAGDSTKPLVMMVHGSPGSLSAFIDFLGDSTFTKDALVVAVDRPGFGHSNFGTAMPSLENQAKALLPILQKYSANRPIILVGHSLGGPVIARIAIDYPQYVDGLVLVSASVDPDLEPNETWFRAPLATPFLSWILPRSLRASNDEIYQLKPQLETMKPLWDKITCPVYIIHGGKDGLVPKENVQFAQRMLSNTHKEIIFREDVNHFIPWSHPALIKEAVFNLLHDTRHGDLSGN